jgi:phosphatidylinositol alpha 1,6-mannosyltransferase
MVFPSESQRTVPRVAYFPDSFHEVNGVAHTSRHFEAYARRHGLPFLCARAGGRPTTVTENGTLTVLELRRGIFSVPLDKDLHLDPVFFRHLRVMDETVRRFRPDIVHITGPSDVGLMAAAVAILNRIPIAASWHTNVHEYAAKRSQWLFSPLPRGLARAAAAGIEEFFLRLTSLLYSWAEVNFAPNEGLCRLLERTTGRPCHLMQRGVDTELFSPEKRTEAGAGDFVLGYVGRLSVEKNVALLAQIQQELEARGLRNFRFRIVGQGLEETWLRERLPRAEFTGVLRGEALARAYAGMDVFVFPSHTDTFGNVVLEALASGVPAVVTRDGGPCSIVRDGETGCVAEDAEFSGAIAGIISCPGRHARMRQAARAYALTASWDAVFDKVYEAYRGVLSGLDSPAGAGAG